MDKTLIRYLEAGNLFFRPIPSILIPPQNRL